jgi:hypothetical protein
MRAWQIGEEVSLKNIKLKVVNYIKTKDENKIIRETFFLHDAKNHRLYRYVLGGKTERIY